MGFGGMAFLLFLVRSAPIQFADFRKLLNRTCFSFDRHSRMPLAGIHVVQIHVEHFSSAANSPQSPQREPSFYVYLCVSWCSSWFLLSCSSAIISGSNNPPNPCHCQAASPPPVQSKVEGWQSPQGQTPTAGVRYARTPRRLPQHGKNARVSQ